MTTEDVERRLHWLRLARELGAEDDFRALMDDLKREGAANVCQTITDKILALHGRNPAELGVCDTCPELYPCATRRVLTDG